MVKYILYLTFPETNISPENEESPFPVVYFQGQVVSFRQCTPSIATTKKLLPIIRYLDLLPMISLLLEFSKEAILESQPMTLPGKRMSQKVRINV